MDYSVLSDDELKKLFFWSRDYHFRKDFMVVIGYRRKPENMVVIGYRREPESIDSIKSEIHKGLKLLTPNVVEWAFEYVDDWRQAQAMTTYIACGQLKQYTHLVGKQLEQRRYCEPYICCLAYLATSEVIPYLEHFIDEKMTPEIAKTTNSWDWHIDIALEALDWLSTQHGIKSKRDYTEKINIFNTTIPEYPRFPDTEHEPVRLGGEGIKDYFTGCMIFLEEHFG